MNVGDSSQCQSPLDLRPCGHSWPGLSRVGTAALANNVEVPWPRKVGTGVVRAFACECVLLFEVKAKWGHPLANPCQVQAFKKYLPRRRNFIATQLVLRRYAVPIAP